MAWLQCNTSKEISQDREAMTEDLNYLGKSMSHSVTRRSALRSLAGAMMLSASMQHGMWAQRKADWDGEGDAPKDPGPLATDLSTKLTPAAIAAALRKVANWQVERSAKLFSQDWTYGALYPGLLAASRTLSEPRYEQAVMAVGERYDWQLGPRLIAPDYIGHGQARGQTYDANNQALAQAYIALYKLHHDSKMIAGVRKRFDELIVAGGRTDAPLWWWCDALFMAPASWVMLYEVTGNKAYLDYMDHRWWETSDYLYDKEEHLFFRDSNFFVKKEPNGKKMFWSRGNGWVVAGLALVLEGLPKEHPSRAKYVKQLQEMSQRLLEIQSADGLWRPGLLDPDAYSLPELSGSGFFTYAMTWGVRHGVLDRKAFLPAITKAWDGMLSHIYADGRLGSIQPIASGPGNYAPSASSVYGVGAFLLAGCELHKLVAKAG